MQVQDTMYMYTRGEFANVSEKSDDFVLRIERAEREKKYAATLSISIELRWMSDSYLYIAVDKSLF